jgi:hypothetical protein
MLSEACISYRNVSFEPVAQLGSLDNGEIASERYYTRSDNLFLAFQPFFCRNSLRILLFRVKENIAECFDRGRQSVVDIRGIKNRMRAGARIYT